MSMRMWRRTVAGTLLTMLAVAVSVRAQEATVRDGPPEGGHYTVSAQWALAAVPAQATTPPPPPPAPAPPQGPSREDEDTPARQAPPPPPPAPPRATPRTQARPAIAGEPPRAVVEPQYVSKGVNIRIDATVTESRGDQTLGRKVVSITLVDGDSGSVRSSAMVPVGTDSFTRVPLNMDARGRIRDDNRVQAQVTLDYNRGSVEFGESGTQRVARDSGIRQSVSVILENGKPLVVAQSADPEGDRRVTLELRATILK